MKKSYYFYGLIFLAICAGAIGIIARFYNFGFPNEKIFDEVYFPVFANDYLTRSLFYDVHPPFGKWIIAIGIFIFRDNPFGWRIIPAVFGLAIPFLFACLALKQNKTVASGIMLFTLASIETILIAYSRAGLMDGIMLFFIFACWLLAIRITRPRQLFGLSILLGLTFAIKWIALGILVPLLYIMWRKKMLWQFLASLLISAFVYELIVTVGQWLIMSSSPIIDGLNWNKSAWKYHLDLTATHPWGSPWWSWPILKRPVLFYYHEDGAKIVRLISAIGNPLVWWSSTIAVAWSTIYLLWVRFRQKISIKDHVLLPLVIGYFAFWLPWAPVHRVLFNYHYLPAYGMALLILSYWLNELWQKKPVVCLLVMFLFVASGIFFLPWACGIGMNHFWLAKHVWVQSWLY